MICAWLTVISRSSLAEGWVYLAVIIDLFSRQVVGWSMQPHMKAELVTDALRMAWFRRRPEAGVIVHSDPGQPVLQRPVSGHVEGLRHALVDEPTRRLLGQCADGKPVGSAEGSTYAWTALHHAACRNG
ncbi:MAG: Integrase catalytic region [Caballeronia mineralivorans]|nr:Integrase catalytic region [Caballeronia mineralivorans]